jgi:hypothetical protein
MSEAGGLRRGRDRHDIHQRPLVLMGARMRDASRNCAGDGSDQRGVGAENQERRELDDERRRHRRAVFGHRRLRCERRKQDTDQDESAELDGPIGLKHARVVEDPGRCDRCRGDGCYACETTIHGGGLSKAKAARCSENKTLLNSNLEVAVGGGSCPGVFHPGTSTAEMDHLQ